MQVTYLSDGSVCVTQFEVCKARTAEERCCVQLCEGAGAWVTDEATDVTRVHFVVGGEIDGKPKA